MSISSTIRYTVNSISVSDGQFLQVRLKSFSRDVSQPSASGVPNMILHQSPSTLISNRVFPLPLSQFQDPFSCEFYVARLLSTLNLRFPAHVLAEEITFYATRFASRNNGWNNFCITVDMDYIHDIWIDRIPELYRARLARSATHTARVDETLVLGSGSSEEMRTTNTTMSGSEINNLGMKGASESTIRRLKKETFVGLGDELGDCCICYDDLCGGKEVVKMPCTHLFHGSCIFRWLKKNNSCPLCRTRVED